MKSVEVTKPSILHGSPHALWKKHEEAGHPATREQLAGEVCPPGEQSDPGVVRDHPDAGDELPRK